MKQTFTHLLRHALAVGAIVATPMIAWAGTGDYVVVLTKDGGSHETLISDISRIALGADKLSVVTPDGSSDYSYSDIDRIDVGVNSAAIEAITADGAIAIWPSPVTDILNVNGAEPATAVKAYAVNGSLVASGITAADGSLTLDLSAAPSGVCVVTVGARAVKVVKK